MEGGAPGDVILVRRRWCEEERNSRQLLVQTATEISGLSERELGEIVTNPWGKPSFSLRPELHVSVTHSQDWWVCGFSDAPLGVDVQVHRTHVPPRELSRRFFHPAEDAFLARGGYEAFFDVWSAKESWVKFTGRGFYDEPGSFSVVDPAGGFPAVEGVQLRLIPFAQGYSCCVCAARLGRVTVLDK